MNNLAGLFKDLEQKEKAVDIYEKSLKIKSEHFGMDSIELLDTLNYLGVLKSNMGDYEGAK